MPSPSHHDPGRPTETPGGARPGEAARSSRHREAVELAARITRTIRILEELDLTGIAPAPVLTLTDHGATGRPL
ncbi:hypothetical protein [Streptomyces sp. NPDC020597]|uniref:hypothetical protein n=1 Tax=unclassified Streptomyces TaxID=2593676 RepID=UPI0037A0B586